MEEPHFAQEPTYYALSQAELGRAVGDICRPLGIADAAFHPWQEKYDWLGPSELKPSRLLEEKRRNLKQLIIDLSRDKSMLQEISAREI